MELSGNLWESTISIRNNVGAAFVGTAGDGPLSISSNAGFADQMSWPNQKASLGSYSSAPGKVIPRASWNEPFG